MPKVGQKNPKVNKAKMKAVNPLRLETAAYHGFAGEFVRDMSNYTEGTDAGVLAHLLPLVGTLVGGDPHLWNGARHHARVLTVLVGPTSTGRKGTALVPVECMMEEADPEFWRMCCVPGLSSGEGIIKKVSGSEKRLYVIEKEFASVLIKAKRDGNTLSTLIRECFDSGKLATLTRSDPLQTDGAHVCITGHITEEELKSRLSKTDMANGFANRFLWFAVHSEKVMPTPDPIPAGVIARFAERLNEIVRFAKSQKQLVLSRQAKRTWEEMYLSLRRDRTGFAGLLMARGVTIVLRLALIYALMDMSKVVGTVHLKAAMAVWEYSEKSVEMMFGTKSTSDKADTIYKLLADGPMNKTDLWTHINWTKEELNAALGKLDADGLIRKVRCSNGKRGRPAEKWERVA